ncbi:MAG TPA: Cj0069 family protein [Caulobacteraceae bacterium]|nr:Cj0069 family protein [Caulobacteraceae bacterium]
MVDAADGAPVRIALVWRGDPAAPPPVRFNRIVEALAERGAAGEGVVYDETVGDAVRERLLGVDGVVVWVNPLQDGKDRSGLDPLLREVAAAGVYVSARPEVILKMGTKEVLYDTRDLGWGVDVELYRSEDDFRRRFPAKLAGQGPRVLKQHRGNGGQGVWKVTLLAGAADAAAPVEVLHAQWGSSPERIALGAFMHRCGAYFAGDGRIIDQAFQPRLPEGMIRCYLAGGKVAGYGQQLIKALIPPPPEGPQSEAARPGPRIMHPPEAAPFQDLRRLLEDRWIPQMQARLGVATADLPALWDADFLFGPKTPDGRDTYVLCEINVSAVAPYPDSAAVPVAEAAIAGARAARAAKGVANA